MKELYYEETVEILNLKTAKTRYKIFKLISVVSYVMMALWIYVMMMYVLNPAYLASYFLLGLGPAAVFCATGTACSFIKNKFFTEYDYSLLTGSVRFSKIINRNKRKAIMSFSTADIERIGRIGSETYNKFAKMPDVSKRFFTPNNTAAEGKGFYYLFVNHRGSKLLLTIECSKVFISNVFSYCKRHVLEDK